MRTLRPPCVCCRGRRTAPGVGPGQGRGERLVSLTGRRTSQSLGRGGAALRAGSPAAAPAAAASVRHAPAGCCERGHRRSCSWTPAPPAARASPRLLRLLLTIFFFACILFLFRFILFKAGAVAASARGGEGAAGGCGAGLRSLRPLLLPGSGPSAEQVGTGTLRDGKRALAKGTRGPRDRWADPAARETMTGATAPRRPPFSPPSFAPSPEPPVILASHLGGPPPFRSHPPLLSKSPGGISQLEDSASPLSIRPLPVPTPSFPLSLMPPQFPYLSPFRPQLRTGRGTHKVLPGSGSGGVAGGFPQYPTR